MSELDAILNRRADAAGEDVVYVEGGLVRRVPTVPVDGGVGGIVRFAHRCWTKLVEQQMDRLRIDRQLHAAQSALSELQPSSEVARAIAAVGAARELLLP